MMTTDNRQYEPGTLTGYRRTSVYRPILILWIILIAAFASSNASADTLTLYPSGANGSDSASYSGATAATALDSNDGDSSYGRSTSSSNDFYLEIDDTAHSGTIDSVQVSVRARCDDNDCDGGGGWSSEETDFRIGISTNGSSYYDSGHTEDDESYTLYHGTTYNTNPQTGSDWTWTEVDDLVAIVDHQDSIGLRVTELYVTVNYTVPPDSTAPDAISDLATNAPTSTSIGLTWTAPGDDAATGTATSYDIRYSTSEITEGNWASATQASGEPAPSVAGSDESFTVTGLDPGTTYYFAIKTSDEIPNTSSISNVPSATTDATDSTAPASITLSAGSPGESSVLLSWTAPGDDDNTGTATDYDIRYSTSAITEGNWSGATQVSGEPAPQTAGSIEYFTVTGLSADTTYYFAIKASDEVPNISAISNSPSATTTSGGGGGVELHPSGSATGDNVSYSGGTAATALDTNDGGSSYGSSSGSSNDYYLEIDDTALGGVIDDVRVSAYVACASSCDGGWDADDPTTFRIGLKTIVYPISAAARREAVRRTASTMVPPTQPIRRPDRRGHGRRSMIWSPSLITPTQPLCASPNCT